MENKNFKDISEQPINRSKIFWRYVGVICLSVALAVLTVVVINIS